MSDAAEGMLGSQGRIWIGYLLGWIPAVVLLYAAILKGLDPLLFADQITAHKITPPSWSLGIAYIFIAAELVIAFALILFIRPRLTHALVIAMMIGFIAVTAIAWSQGNAKECGCFGRSVSRGPLVVILQDAAIIVVSIVARLLLHWARTPRSSVPIFLFLVPISLLFTALGAKLPADAWVTGLRPGSDLSDLPIEDLRVSHAEGTVLLVLLGENCAPCVEAIPSLNEIARGRADALRIVGVYAGTRQSAVAWRIQNLPAFPIAHASARAIRAYHRTLPTAFLLREGRLVRAYWGRIPSSGTTDLPL